MKNFKLLLILLVGLSIVTASCKKTEEQQTEDLINEILDVKGSIDLNVNGTTYNKLFSSVVYAESDKMVSFWAYELDTEDSFIVTFGEVPEVGGTAVVDLNSEESVVFIIMGSFLDGDGYYGQSGSVHRVSTDEYQLDIQVNNSTMTATPISITGTIKVGEHNP